MTTALSTTAEAPAKSHSAAPLRHDIQALRAAAVLSVLVFHFWPHRLRGGFVGVDVFFVISGFLITGQLLRTATTEGRVRLGEFWKRRALRLLPSSLLVLLVTAVATLVWVPQYRWSQFFSEIAASTLYVQNWLLANNATDYLASTNAPSAAQHFWTLSVEEQFYLVVPVLIALAILATRSRWRLVVGIVLVAVTAASFAYSIHDTSADPSGAYFVTTTRAWEFGVGGLLAFVGSTAPRLLGPAAAWGGLALIAASDLVISQASAFPGWIAAAPVAGTALVIWAAQTSGLFARLAGLAPVQWLGEISYALYLWHWPILVIAPIALGEVLAWPTKLVLVAVTVLLAWVTTVRFEEPIRFGLARRPGGRRVALSATAVVMVGVVGASLGANASIQSRAGSVEEKVRAYLGPCFGAEAALRDACPAPTELVPPAGLIAEDRPAHDDCLSHDGSAELKRCTLGPADAKRHVAAIGDSHVWALTPALEIAATELGWSIDVMSHSGCYWTTAHRVRDNATRERECTDWVASVDDYLDHHRPYDAIIVTHKEGVEVSAAPGVSQLEATVEGMLAAWAPVQERGTRIIALSDVPKFPERTLDCIARSGLDAATKCSVRRRRALPEHPSTVVAVARSHRAASVDLGRRIYCPTARCSPVVGGVVMQFDDGHLSNSYSLTLGHYLTAGLRQGWAASRS